MSRPYFPARIDVEFYRSKQTLPAWAIKVSGQRKVTATEKEVAHALIDGVVQAHGGVSPTNGEIAASNLLAILRSNRRRGEDLYAVLRELAWRPECAINPEKRAAYARKWAARIARVS